MIERCLAKAEVAGLSPVSRSKFFIGRCSQVAVGVRTERVKATVYGNSVNNKNGVVAKW